MKKLLVAAAVFALSANAALAQDQAAGNNAGAFAFGSVTTAQVVAGAVAVGVLAAVISNNSGSSLPDEGGPQPVPTCNQGDQLSGNVCIATTQTVTVSGTGTVTVPVTSTYAPTVR